MSIFVTVIVKIKPLGYGLQAMPYMAFVADLKNCGFSDKEAAVYLAMLSLGPNTILNISRKAKVARATTYLIVETLKRRELVREYYEGERTYFMAEDLEYLEKVMDREEIQLRIRRNQVKKLIPKLKAFTRSVDDRPVVQYYDGLTGLNEIRQEITRRSNPGDEWYHITPIELLGRVFGNHKKDIPARRAKRIKQKIIFTANKDRVKKETLNKNYKESQSKYISPRRLKTKSGVTICGDFVAFGNLDKKLGGIIIESKSLAGLMKGLFEEVWSNLE